MSDNQPLYTFQFFVLCFSQLLFSGSFNMIIPELPAYLTSLGGEDYKGFIIALFTLSAAFSRPFSGKLTDTIGRLPVMVIGTLVCVVCSLAYPLLTSVSGFMLLRLMHGFSTGFRPTASTAYVADIVPVGRRAEAMGMIGVSMNLGASMFPPLGSWLSINHSPDYMFYVASFIALVSILMLFGLKETLVNKAPFSVSILKIKSSEIIEPSVIPAAIVAVCVYLNFGVLITVSPDQSDYLGIANRGMLFTSFTIFSVLSRLVAGKTADRYGRVPVIKVGSIMSAASLLYMGMADSAFDLFAASGCLGFSLGVVSPAVFAWVIDLSVEERRGRGTATLYIALEIGIGMGALVSAWIYNNNDDYFFRTYLFAAIVTILPLFYLTLTKKKG